MEDTTAHPQILKKIADASVLCVGDLMLDQFVYGQVNRLSPEAPVPVLLADRTMEVAGGVGNVAANLLGLGCRVHLVAVTGADEAEKKIKKALAGIMTTLVPDPSRPTICKTRFSVGQQQLMRVDVEDTSPISTEIEAALIKAALQNLEGCKALLLSDYGKGTLTPHVLKILIGAAHASGIPVIVDPKGQDYTRYKGAGVITPNRKELAEATGDMPNKTDAEIEAAARALMAASGVQAVVATRSADGMSVIDAAGATHLPTVARAVFDVSGAGDTVAATIAAALATGASLRDAASMANIAAGRVVEKAGTAAIKAEELSSAFKVPPVLPKAGQTLAPVCTWTQAAAQVERWKMEGLKVGFTNGCFDILHLGHVMMLDKCRSHCDRLVLGLNADSSVTRLKGAGRPVNAEEARAKVLAGLGSVDAVVVFGTDEAEGDTPLALMKVLRPDVIFKGQDYTIDKVVGADFVQSYGGQVVLVSFEDGFSTTGTIKKLNSAA